MPATLSPSPMAFHAAFCPHLVPKGHSLNRDGFGILSNKLGPGPISDLLLWSPPLECLWQHHTVKGGGESLWNSGTSWNSH